MSRLAELTLAHLSLSVWALLLGSLISVPLGIAASRRPRLERVVLGVASVIQTVPGLALLAVMVPALASLSSVGIEAPSIGALPAVLGLTLYSLLPILRNTVVGLREVPREAKAAARGVGMSTRQALFQVELPLAMPTLVAGLRTATVWTVGMATLATPVGGSSLGDLIFAGLQTRDHGSVLLGCAASAGLALTLDGLLRLAEHGRAQRKRAVWVGAVAVISFVFLGAMIQPALSFVQSGDDPIRIGAKPFTEQYILAERIASEARASGETPEVLSSLGSNVAFDALVAGDLDLYVEYTGTVWTSMMHRADLPADRDTLRGEVTRWLSEEHGVTVVATLGFENAYALAVRAEANGGPPITRISQLGPLSTRMTVAGDYELFERGEWRALESTYGLHFQEQRTMDPTLLYTALAEGQVDVIGAYTTDGRIAAFDLRVLEDDRGAIPPYDAILLASPALVARAPEFVEALGSMEGSLSNDAMRQLNRAVDVDGQTPAEAATTQ
ncbi:MAG: ABC transporter permease/substrate-binding protein [Sandaracinaceae bacterium]